MSNQDDSSWARNLTYRATTLQFTKSPNYDVKWAKIVGELKPKNPGFSPNGNRIP